MGWHMSGLHKNAAFQGRGAKFRARGDWVEAIGNLHVHSVHSDGAGTVAQIARIAERAGLDFVGINDHAHMVSRLNKEEEGRYGNVFVFIGLEFGEEEHHYLAYGAKRIFPVQGLRPQEVIDRVSRQGGFGFLAHPFEKGMPFREKSRAYTWNDLSANGYAGICIWNFASRWKERIRSPWHGLFFLLFKHRTLKGPSRKTLRFWDDQCQKRRVCAIGGSDAHGVPFRWAGVNFVPLSYRGLLNSINVHVLLETKSFEDFERARESIFTSMREGRLFIAHDGLCSASGFKMWYGTDSGRRIEMGQETKFEPGNLVVECPFRGEIRLFRNGKLNEMRRGLQASKRIAAEGVYRVEVYRRVPLFGLRPWIFSNPVYLR